MAKYLRPFTNISCRNQCTTVPSLLLNIGYCSLPGRSCRKSNEDFFDVQKFAPNIQYFGVFDGHNGTFVSNFVNKNLPTIIKERLISNHFLYDAVFDILENVLVKSFEECQCLLKETLELQKGLQRKEMIGSTAVVGLLIDNKFLTIANVGDSKAILFSDGEPKELTVEHIPDNLKEAQRVENDGGWIDWDSRFKPLVNGRLSMTRSFGNLLLKPTGVTCEPAIHHRSLDEFKDSFVVLCSDGITHTMTDEEIVYIVNQHDDPMESAEDLTSTAHQYGSDDDATAVVVPLGAWRDIELKNHKQNYSMFRTIVGGRSGG